MRHMGAAFPNLSMEGCFDRKSTLTSACFGLEPRSARDEAVNSGIYFPPHRRLDRLAFICMEMLPLLGRDRVNSN